MKPPIPVPRSVAKHFGWLLATLVPVAVAASEAPSADHEEPLPANSKVHHPWPGGVDPRPYIQSVSSNSTAADQLLLQWSGLGGPYKVQQRSLVSSGDWTDVGQQTTDSSMSVPAVGDTGYFRVQGPAPDYIGASVCRACHASTHDNWLETAHHGALDTLKAIGQASNSRCLACHTVGYGLPGGFVSEAATPRLAGVQCENCHGPGGAHVADPGDLAARPVVSLASMTCGGCHNDFHHPTYDEWLKAGHSRVHPELVSGFMNTNIVAAEARMRSCGACHSGGVRLAMLDGYEDQVNLPPMPSGDVAANTPMTCAVCHTSHEHTDFGSQLRNPSYSTNFFSYATSTNTSFTAQYKVDINICGQCHNQRGATWKDTSRPPHHSPQYNMLVGQVGFEIGTAPQSSHTRIAKQCTECHTHRHDPEHPTEEDPVYTGHEFKPYPENCVNCHTVEEAEAFVGFTQRTTKNGIASVKSLLDSWGETKAIEPLRLKYGKLAWEYNNAGQLSQPESGPAVRGPTSAEQTDVPDGIKQARFFLYLVEHDGSYGVHNGQYARHLLEQAKKLAEAELAKP